jgi:4-hydroxy-2-oxoheptanedioate aldolase
MYGTQPENDALGIGGLRAASRGDTVIGGWLMLGSAFAGELVAGEALDYLVVDCQHGLTGHTAMVDTLGRSARHGIDTLVRIPSLEGGWAGLALDAGADGVIVPMVSSPADAAAAVAAVRYPPHGTRSFGPIRPSRRVGADPAIANERVVCVVMIETAAGVESIDEICSVPGVDAIYVGPADLSLALGVDPWSRSAALDAALDTIRRACVRHDVVPGIHASSGRHARALAEAGFRMVTAVSDVDAMRRGVAREVAAARGVEGS